MARTEILKAVGLFVAGSAVTVIVAQGQNTWVARHGQLGVWLFVVAVIFFLLAALKSWPWLQRVFWIGCEKLVPHPSGHAKPNFDKCVFRAMAISVPR
jgi:hypothetical protein